MTRRGFLPVTAVLVLMAAPAIAQPAPPPPANPTQEQLDRIEQKLNALLRRLPPPLPDTAAPAVAHQGPEATPASSIVPPAPDAQPQSTATTPAYQPGALAVARPAPAANAVLAISPDAVGSFAFTGGTLRLDDLASRGVHYHGQTGVELQGWLRVQDTGRFQFAVDFGSPRANTAFVTLACGVALWLEDRQIGQQSGELMLLGSASPGPLTLVLGAELVPGLYRMRLWIACGRTGTPQPVPITADILFKTPAEPNLRGLTADDVLHREG